MDWVVPTLAGVLDARERISAYLRPALQLSGQLAGKRVALMVTGGNASRDQIIDVLTRQQPGA